LLAFVKLLLILSSSTVGRYNETAQQRHCCENKKSKATTLLSNRPANAARAARRVTYVLTKVHPPPKFEENVILQSLVKLSEEE
jgi:hypothetical protein